MHCAVAFQLLAQHNQHHSQRLYIIDNNVAHQVRIPGDNKVCGQPMTMHTGGLWVVALVLLYQNMSHVFQVVSLEFMPQNESHHLGGAAEHQDNLASLHRRFVGDIALPQSMRVGRKPR